MSLKRSFKSTVLSNGDTVTRLKDGSSLTIYGDSYTDGHMPGERIWRNAQGQYHRAGGPAVEWPTGHKEWWQNGQRHREDGPAIERATPGNDEYWLKGARVKSAAATGVIHEKTPPSALDLQPSNPQKAYKAGKPRP